MSTLSLYIHIPWCVRKCPYCDFNSHQQKGELPEQQYLERLLQDLDHDIASFNLSDRRISSIFIGGGTPSLFSADSIHTFLTGVAQRLSLSDACEITLEANPGTFEAEKFSGFREAGVNRLSIGIQSFNDEQLKKLGRIHNSTEAKAAIQMAFTAGFDNINLDLMYALSNQTIADALLDLHTAFSFPITHLSHYQLTLEPNTLFAKYPPKLPKDDFIWDMQLACQQYIQQQNFQQYEVSAYAQVDTLSPHTPRLASQHNLNYWRFGDYLAIGAGAHGKITLTDGSMLRTMKPKHPRQYQEAEINPAFQNRSAISSQDAGFEYFLNRLRLCESFSAADFTALTGLDFASVKPQIDDAIQKHWLSEQQQQFRVTATGQQFLNDLQALFLP